MISFTFKKVSQYLDTTVFGPDIQFNSRLLSVAELKDLTQNLKDAIEVMEDHIQKFDKET